MALQTLEELADFFASDTRFVGTVKQNEPLFARTTMHVGGNAALLIEPADEDSLRCALAAVRENDVPFFVLGGGSNVIISDRGFSGAVICTRKLSGVKFLTEGTEPTEDGLQGKDASLAGDVLRTRKLSGGKLSTDYTDDTDGERCSTESERCSKESMCRGKDALVPENSLWSRVSRSEHSKLCEEFINTGAVDSPLPEEKSVEIGVICGYITVAAGTPWGAVISGCREHDVGGLEAFAGLSGTVGGAVYMNATCFGLSACDRLVSVRYVDAATGEICEYVLDDEKRQRDWGYKKSPFARSRDEVVPKGALRGTPRRGGYGANEMATRGELATSTNVRSFKRTSPRKIILSATFALTKGFDAEKVASCLAQRKEKGHFRLPSAGSVFKNVVQHDAAQGIVAGKLIDECGLKGLQVGGAQVAPWHGNFIVNAGNATAQDVFDLTRRVQAVVREKKGVSLECEIIFIGEFSQSEFSHIDKK